MEELAYKLTAPSWPPQLGPIDQEAAARGKLIYMSHDPKRGCARCHDNYDDTKKDGNAIVNEYRLSSLEEVGTDPNEALNFTPSVQVNKGACQGNNGPTEWLGFDKAHETVIGQVSVDADVNVVSNPGTEINRVFNGGRGKPEWKVRAQCDGGPFN